MAFTPSSSLASGGASGHVIVDNFPAVQPISGAVDVSDRAGRIVGQVSGGANVFHVDDNGGSLTVDAPGLATDANLDRLAESLDDVALTAILERDKLEP